MKSEPFKKISLTAAVVVLLLIVTSPVTTIWLIRKEAVEIVKDSLPGLTTSSLATMHVSEGFLDTALAVNGGGMSADQLQEELAAATKLVDAEYDAHRETLKTDLERDYFVHLTECRKRYRETRAEVVSLFEAGQTGEAAKLFEDECVAKYQTYADALGKVVEHNAREARTRGAEIIKLCFILLLIQVFLLAFFFVYGFFVPLTAFIERLTRRPVEFDE